MRISSLPAYLSACLPALLLAFSFPAYSPPALADGLPDLGDAGQVLLSPQMERRIGESVVREMRLRDPEFVDDPELTEYINVLGNRLVANSQDVRQDFEFFLVRDSTMNAFAMPGGFIGVHTGLIVAAQSESELAAVLAHEIAHVTQRHMARMVSKDGQLSMAMMAAMAVALLSRNTQLGSAAAVLGQSAAITAQIGFTRDFEREADRLGFLTLEKSQFDVRAMPEFFLRLQKAGRLYENNAPAYLRTHPVTTERIADAQNRIQGLGYRQKPDSMDFQLVRAKLRAEQGAARDTLAQLQGDFKDKKYSNETAARFGLAVALLRSKDNARAEAELAPLVKSTEHPMIAGLAARIKQAKGDNLGAAETIKLALVRYPNNRALNHAYVEALQQQERHAEAAALLDEQIRNYPRTAQLYALRAKSYASMGKRLLQHQSQAEAYVLQGSLPAAIEQLQLAQKSGDGDFYQLSSVDARLRSLRQQMETERKEAKEGKPGM
ncbi:MAG: M48 family metalloprotease [Proteobacteria bacterium]|nr:M48 family metalloprotease [Pseudomonadota bacterium]